MSKQNQIYVLIALLLIAAYIFYAERSEGPGIAGVLASDSYVSSARCRGAAPPLGPAR